MFGCGCPWSHSRQVAVSGRGLSGGDDAKRAPPQNGQPCSIEKQSDRRHARIDRARKIGLTSPTMAGLEFVFTHIFLIPKGSQLAGAFRARQLAAWTAPWLAPGTDLGAVTDGSRRWRSQTPVAQSKQLIRPRRARRGRRRPDWRHVDTGLGSVRDAGFASENKPPASLADPIPWPVVKSTTLFWPLRLS